MLRRCPTIQNQTASILPGVNVSNSIEYFYNNLKNIRAEMLSEATRNAKERADSVADAGGANIGKIISLSRLVCSKQQPRTVLIMMEEGP